MEKWQFSNWSDRCIGQLSLRLSLALYISRALSLELEVVMDISDSPPAANSANSDVMEAQKTITSMSARNAASPHFICENSPVERLS